MITAIIIVVLLIGMVFLRNRQIYDESLSISVIASNHVSYTILIPAILSKGTYTPAEQKLIANTQANQKIQINKTMVLNKPYLEISGDQVNESISAHILLDSFLDPNYENLKTMAIYLSTSNLENITFILHQSALNGTVNDRSRGPIIAYLKIELQNGWISYDMTKYLRVAIGIAIT